jgi:hypothetical protein
VLESATRTPPAIGAPNRQRPVRALVLYAVNEGRKTLSYQQGWPQAFARDPRFVATCVNVMTRRGRLATHAALKTRRFDAIIVLHSVLSNEGVIFGRLLDALAHHRAPKAYFIGNEYKLMPQKMEFCERIGVSLLVTMMHSERVHELYRQRLGCAVTEIPSAGVDTDVFFPATDLSTRPIDIGMRAFDEPFHLGHQDRRAIGMHFVEHAEAYGLNVDISFSADDRFTAPEYAAFLNRCRGQVGTEAGGEFFELSDDLFRRVLAYTTDHPNTTLDELWPLFFADYGNGVRARSITGRHAEAAATKTVQILFEGGYSGLFEPDVHYLCLAKDFSNVDDVLARFRDDDCARTVAENAYAVATEELTYERLLGRFLEALRPLLPTAGGRA